MATTTIQTVGMIALLAINLAAQGRIHGQGAAPGTGRGASTRVETANPGSVHSNAPAGTPAASADRDFGRDRAEDVGRGKKKGLKKAHPKPTQAQHDNSRK